MKLIQFLNSRNWTYGFILIFLIIAVTLAGCTTTKIYTTQDRTCTWQTVEQLIICKEVKK